MKLICCVPTPIDFRCIHMLGDTDCKSKTFWHLYKRIWQGLFMAGYTKKAPTAVEPLLQM